MKIFKLLVALLITVACSDSNSVYNYKLKTTDGSELSLNSMKGKYILVVNTASKCGLTPQYEGLQNLHEKYKDKGVVILGVPCNQFLGQEPGTDEEIGKFCKLNYGVDFKILSKADVRGETAIPLYKFLTNKLPFEGFDTNTKSGKFFDKFLSEKQPEIYKGNGIKWNFTKFLIGKDGVPLKRFEPTVKPEEIDKYLEEKVKI